ncbi:hypothetical protein [Novosphingobium resinovorum]|uniref:hypothetical protein n=1 Tax=Novosphingobium resinovorum TaxID=158500 RepID=UPI002ED69FF1|nr:hypothetical protein [Novosphingobium resinovorum]
MTGEDLAIAARGLVGSPFRLHGRDPASGLDCVGVIEAAFAKAGMRCRLPNGYRLRARDLPDAAALASALGLERTDGAIAAGDVLLLRPSPCQFHLVLAVSPAAVVHAHAGLRKVVLGPLPDQWSRYGHWRLPPDTRN